MTLDRLHRVTTALTLEVGLLVLWLSTEFPPSVMAIASLAVVAGLSTWPYLKGRLAGRVITVVALLLAMLALWAAFDTGNYLYYAVIYAVALAAIRALAMHRSADFTQVYVLSFLHLVAGAVINPGLSFGLLALPYVVLLTLALMLGHFRREVEAHVGARRGGAIAGDLWLRVQEAMARQDIVRPRLLLLTGLVSLGVFLFSAVFFVTFPRMGLGFFAKRTRPGIAMSGFSDRVELGDFGNIIADPEVVMRVRPLVQPLRMRGQSLDYYDGTAWTKTSSRRLELPFDREGRARADFSVQPLENPIVQEVYLEPMAQTQRVLFGMPMPVAFERPPEAMAALRRERWRFYADAAGDVVLTGPPSVAVYYTVYSRPEVSDPEALRQDEGGTPGYVSDRYLALPQDLDPRIRSLTITLTAQARTRYDAVVAIIAWLKSNFTYSLNSSHGKVDPLADFLFQNRTGHCEYFATALAVMLRTIGIPSRVVTGFYGGEWNEYGGYVAIRKADAHSWVEVFFPRHGWVTFDPTKEAALDLRAKGSLFWRVSEAMDALKLAWYRWVVEYDLEKQVGLFVSLLGWKEGGSGPFGQVGLGWDDMRALRKRVKEVPWGMLGLSVALAIGLLAGIWHLMRRRPGAPRTLVPAVMAYRQACRLLARRGLRRGPAETQLEFARRVALAFPRAGEAMAGLTWAYLEAMYWRGGADRAKLQAMLEALRAGLDRSAHSAPN